ncbi:MAG: DUF45 domain-containing protein [Clostridia bacterium]|nr:DUF45 domain-containing protein [Clostridia bacterium]
MGVLKFRKTVNNQTYLTVSVLGQSLKLNVKYTNTSSIELNKNDTEIDLFLPKMYKNVENIDVINMAIQKLYNTVAETEIEYAMEVARHILRFAPEDYSIKRLEDEFYKCSKNKIVVNPDIVRFNREIINTTIIQAFCKIKYRPNTIAYKKLLNNAMNEYEIYKKKEHKLKILKVS